MNANVTRSRAPIFGLLGAVLLAVLFYFLLYSPRNDELALIREETVTLDTQRVSLQGEVARLREIESNQVQIRSALARLEEFVPSGPAQSTAVRQFQLAADASGVEIDSVSFAAPELIEGAPPSDAADTALARISVNMTLTGGYFQIVDFMRRIEVETPRALLMVGLDASEAEDGFPSLTSTWVGDLFAVVPVTSIPPPADPVDPEANPEANPEAEGEDIPVDDDATEATAQGATS